MKKLWKIVALCSAAAILATGLASCKPDPAAGKTVISFWHPFGGAHQKEIVEEWVKSYNEYQDKYYVEAKYIADPDTKLQTFSAGDGKNLPDVCHFNRYKVQEWAAQGLLYDMTDLAQTGGVNPDDFYEYAWVDSTYKDKLYCMPWDVDNRQFFINTKMFRDAGLDPNNPPKTIAELDEIAPKMDKIDGSRYENLGFIPWLDEGSLITWGYVFGGDWQNRETGELTPDDPKNIEALEWMKSYTERYNVASVSAFTSTDSAISPFASKRLGMIVSGSWKVNQYDTVEGLEYKVCPIPNPEGENFKTWGAGTGLIIPAKAKNAEAAFDFVKYCTYGPGTEISAKHPGLFTAVKGVSDKQTWVKENEIFSLFVEMMPTSKILPQFAKNGYYWNAIQKVQDKALRKNVDIAAEMAKVKENTLEELNKQEQQVQ